MFARLSNMFSGSESTQESTPKKSKTMSATKSSYGEDPHYEVM